MVPLFGTDEKLYQRFMKYVSIPDGINDLKTSDCWLFTGCKNEDGYGYFGINGKVLKAHRVSWLIFKGQIPIGKQINHTCDVRNCVNPNHLYIGTQPENIRDTVSRNRQAKGDKCGVRGNKNGTYTHPEKVARGEKHGLILHPECVQRGTSHWTKQHPEKVAKGVAAGNASLNEEQVVEIRKLYQAGISQKVLSEQFNTGTRNISKIVLNQRWKHVGEKK